MDAQQILEELEAVASPERREAAASYTPTALRMLGVRVPDLRIIVKRAAADLKKADGSRVMETVWDLHRAGVFEGRQVAYELVEGHKGARTSLTEDQVEALGQGMDNWATVDTFAVCVAGPAWREGRVTDARVAAWAASPDTWWRRAALVCTVPLNMKSRGGRGDVPRTLATCRMLVGDRQDMVVKAMSWALREVGERDPEAVRTFLATHDVAARARREVEKKLTTGRKNG